jgi:drug/metabolite transporter (DMT)-like permease
VRVILGALALVLAAALVHASWNLLAKRSGGGAIFVLLFDLVSIAVYLPPAAIDFAIERPPIGPVELGFMAGSGVLHAAYFVFLQRAYRAGDLSLVYPVARGSGLLLATFAAMAVFAERPGAVALAGALVIAAGIFALGGWPSAARRAAVGRALAYSGLTGAAIAVYTLWDKYAVDDLAVPPLIYNWGEGVAFAFVLLPLAWGRLAHIRHEFRAHRREIIGVGILSPLAYILVLVALSFAPVTYVAPAREVSVLIGTALGVHLLAEGHARRRLAAAALIVAGLVALSIR